MRGAAQRLFAITASAVWTTTVSAIGAGQARDATKGDKTTVREFITEPATLVSQQQVQLEAQSRQRRRFKALKEFAEATGQDRHSVLVDYDDFTGRAPDLGAYEVGRPVPHYGPRR